MAHASASPRRSVLLGAALLGAFVAFPGCKSDDDPVANPTTFGELPDPEVGLDDALPGVAVTVTGLSGGSGAGGNFRVGDFVTVHFTVTTDDLTGLDVTSFARGAIMVSGPTYNYQRVIASQSNLLSTVTRIGETEWSYTFTTAIPATYLAPLNDTTDITANELTGTALLPGTYTVGIELRKDYTVESTTYEDAGCTTYDFLLGDATTLEPRAVVSQAACNNCHTKLTAHGGNRNNVAGCLLCHTAGAEDKNVLTVANGTPGATIDFRVMIHKIHAGARLPSVQGVSTNNDGTRNYAATVAPYELVGFGNAIHDYSEVLFPAWPSFYTGTPRDVGFTSLTSGQQTLENNMRRMPVECDACHGDPDGAGPLAAPTNGALIYAQPTRAACGSCHDDVVWTSPYTSNGQTMDAQTDDVHCRECHEAPDLEAAHLHPLADRTVAPGLTFAITGVTDAGGNSDGKLQAGEKVQVTFNVTDDNGNVAASTLSRLEMMLYGPTTNPQMITYQRVAMAGTPLAGTGPYTINLPQIVYLEPIGTSNGSLNTFTTARAPHWNTTTGSTTAATTLLRRTATTTSTTSAAATIVTQNYIDVVSATGFANGDYIVIDDSSSPNREFMRIQWVDGTRLWFSSQYTQTYKPTLLKAHAAGVSVQEITTSAVSSSNWTLTASSGLITETTEFGAGEILCTYTTDFVVPSVYPGALNDSDEVGEAGGDWTGLALENGTYLLHISGARTFTVSPNGETTSYTEGGAPADATVLYGTATEVETVTRTEGPDTCYKCHVDIQFHGGSRKGYMTCLACHATAGLEDGPRYSNSTHTNAATPGAIYEFRNVLHELHEATLPAMPGGSKNCKACHGAANTMWITPADRMHSSGTYPARSWKIACSGCHSTSSAIGHMDSNTAASGYEACAVCHTDGKIEPVTRAHLPR